MEMLCCFVQVGFAALNVGPVPLRFQPLRDRLRGEMIRFGYDDPEPWRQRHIAFDELA